MDIKLFPTAQNCAKALATHIACRAEQKKEAMHIALSGGRTPDLLFLYLSRITLDWKKIHLYWVDERCVPWDHEQSNYGNATQRLIQKIDIPPTHLHPIRGKNDPAIEAERYASELLASVPQKNDLPAFDITILGLGMDGHTASIFPENMGLLTSTQLTAVVERPDSKRITLTGPTLKNSHEIIFHLIGSDKKNVFDPIRNNAPETQSYPAVAIAIGHAPCTWMIDDSTIDPFPR